MINIKRKKFKTIKYVLIGVAVFLTLILLMFNSGVAIFETVSGYVVNPVIYAVNSAADGVSNFFASFGSRTKLKAELELAQQKLAQLENVQSVAEEVKAENERLLALLGEKENYPEFTYEYASVIVRSVDDYSMTFTLNKGENDGIKTNMVVIAPGGLAGKIVKTTPDTSVLLAVTDSRAGVPALSESSRDMGIVRGISDAGSTKGFCMMTDLPSNAIIKPGDIVITSGMGEVFPKGIVVGTITEVSKGGQNEINSTAKLSPAVDFDHLEGVLIIVGTGG